MMAGWLLSHHLIGWLTWRGVVAISYVFSEEYSLAINLSKSISLYWEMVLLLIQYGALKTNKNLF
jgi:hypothetical protein